MHASVAMAGMSHSKTSFTAKTLARTALVALLISFLSLMVCESRDTCAATGTHLLMKMMSFTLAKAPQTQTTSRRQSWREV